MDSPDAPGSAYNQKNKQKGTSLFPKITRGEVTAPPHQSIFKCAPRRYGANEVIFNPQEPPRLSDERVISSKEYRELEGKLAEAACRHDEQMRSISESMSQFSTTISEHKKVNYNLKLSLWELRNELMSLTQAQETESQYYGQLLELLGYEEYPEGDAVSVPDSAT